MSYLVFALKYRPQRFDHVTGQDHVSRTLANALKTGRAAQAYLFSGPRGVGKTSMARILAKALNCEHGTIDEPCNECTACREITSGHAMDVIEIDGASNRGIDDIRELREAVRYSPAILSRKVYIIDEVHMLTTDAFNALLKTLEEPPKHVVFILATTEPLKVPQTILSRCQRFDFARLGVTDAAGRLRFICDQEGLEAEDEALYLIARKGEGSMRDALTLLDQVVATGLRPLTADGVRDALGIASRELFFEWTAAIQAHEPARALRSLGSAVDSGANLQELAEEFLAHLRNLLLVATDAGLSELCEATDDERALYRQQAEGMAQADILRYCRLCLETVTQMRRSGFPRAHLEVALAEMCTLPTALDLRRFIEVARGKFGEVPGDAWKPPQVAGPAAPGGTAGSAAASLPTRSAPPTSSGGGGRPAARPLEATRTASERKPRADGPIAAGIGSAGIGSADIGSADIGSADIGSAEPAAVLSERAASTERPRESVPASLKDGAGSALATTGSSGDNPWTRVLSSVATQKPALASFLAGSTVGHEEEKMLQVRVPGLSSFQKEQLERKANKQLLQEVISETYGRPMGVKFHEAPASSSPPPDAAAAKVARRKAEAASPERIQEIADLFGGDVIGPA